MQEIKSINRKCSTKRRPGPDGFTEFYQTFIKESTTLLNLLYTRGGENISWLILWGYDCLDIKAIKRH